MKTRMKLLSLAAALAGAPYVLAESCEDWKLLVPGGLPIQSLADWSTSVAGFNPEDGLTHILITEQGAPGLTRWFTWNGVVFAEKILPADPQLPFPAMQTNLMYSMCYDEANERMLCLAGTLVYRLMGDEWELLPVVIPVSGARAVYDRARAEVFISKGGVSYVLDGLTVTAVAPGVVPPARDLGGLAYDSRREVVVLHGGRSGSTIYGDTWEWNGVEWTLRTDVLAPMPAYSFAMAWDSRRGRIVRHGGRMSTNNALPAIGETWVYADGEPWSLAPDTGPGGKSSHVLGEHGTTGRLLLLGGTAAQNGADLWISSAPLSIPTTSPHVTVRAGETATLWVHALGADLTHQWLKNDIEIPGATSPVLVIENAGADDMAEYVCLVATPCETSMSQPIDLTVRPAPIPGDVDSDGDVDFADLNFLLSNFNVH